MESAVRSKQVNFRERMLRQPALLLMRGLVFVAYHVLPSGSRI